MAMSLREYLNSKIKAKGSTLTKEKAKAKNYKSIAAAKKAGSLYYTNKDGKVMAAVYAGDLKKATPKKEKLGAGERPKVTVTTLDKTYSGRGDGRIEMTARKKAAKKPNSKKPEDKLVKMAVIAISAGTEPKGKAARIAKLQAEMRRLKKVVDAGKKKKPPVVKRREQARIREIQGILKRMK